MATGLLADVFTCVKIIVSVQNRKQADQEEQHLCWYIDFVTELHSTEKLYPSIINVLKRVKISFIVCLINMSAP